MVNSSRLPSSPNVIADRKRGDWKKLFAWPPARSVAEVLERLSLALLVGGILFEIVTGVLNIQYDYVFGFSFYTAHYYGAWVFLAGFTVHVAIKLPTLVRALRSRSLREELRTPLAETEPEPPDPDGLVPVAPAPPTLSRRGLLGVVGGGSLLLGVMTVGQTVDTLRPLAVLAPRGRFYDAGPNGFQVNRTAQSARIDPGVTGPGVAARAHRGDGTAGAHPGGSAGAAAAHRGAADRVRGGLVDHPDLERVRLRDLVRIAGAPEPRSANVQSLEQASAFNRAALARNQVLDPDSLLALRVNGTDLSLDHGFPARVIVPALPGVHNTKWVRSIEFRST